MPAFEAEVDSVVSLDAWNERIAERISGAGIERDEVRLRRWRWTRDLRDDRWTVRLVDAPEIAGGLDRARATAELVCAAVDAGARGAWVAGAPVDLALLRDSYPARWDAETVIAVFVPIEEQGAVRVTVGLAAFGVPEIEAPLAVEARVLRFGAAYSAERRQPLPFGHRLLVAGRTYAVVTGAGRQALEPV